MIEENIRLLSDFAAKDGLTLRITQGEDGHGWQVRLTSRHHRQPFATGSHETDLGVALIDLLEKAERSVAPYRSKLVKARDEENRQCATELRRMGVR